MRLAQAAVLLFVAQAVVTFVALYDQARDTLTTKVRWYGSATALPDVPSQQLVAVVDRNSGGPRQDARVDAQIVSEQVALAPEWTGVGFAFLRPSPPAGAEVSVSVSAPGMSSRTLWHSQVTSLASWLEVPARLTAESTPRRPELGGPNDGPRVWVRTPEDECTHRVTVAANGGVIARGLNNRVWVRVTDEAGRPVAGVQYRLEPREALEARAGINVVTDTLGIAEFRWVPMEGESWTMTGPCDDGTLERRIVGIPSWDGLLIRVTPPVVEPDRTLRVGVTHQRDWGVWFLDVWCDGVWLRGLTVDVRAGEGVVDVPVALPSDRPRWCTVQASTIRYGDDPPRSLQNVLLVSPGQSHAGALGELARAVGGTGDALAMQLAPLSLASLERADEETVARFGQWLLNRLPHVYQPPTVLIDDEVGAVAEWSEARSTLRSWLLVALSVDGVLVLVAVLGVLIPAARRQRQLMNAAMVDAFDELPVPVDRPFVVIALGVGVLLSVGLGFVQLILYLR